MAGKRDSVKQSDAELSILRNIHYSRLRINPRKLPVLQQTLFTETGHFTILINKRQLFQKLLLLLRRNSVAHDLTQEYA